MSATQSRCSTCGHRSEGATRRLALDAHLKHMAEKHPDVQLGKVFYV